MSGVPATILSFVALALGIIGWAIPYWEYYGNILGQLHIGLWQYCAGLHGNLLGGKNVHDCERLDLFWTISPSMKAVRALVILGSIMQAFALVAAFTKLCVKKEQKSLFQAAGGFVLCSGILMIVGAVVYAVKTRHETEIFISNDYFDLHAGFGLCIVSGCLAIIAGPLYLVDKGRQPPPQNYMTTQPGTVPVQVVYPASGYPAGYPAGGAGVILQPPPSYSYPAVNSAVSTEVKSPPPQQGMPYHQF